MRNGNGNGDAEVRITRAESGVEAARADLQRLSARIEEVGTRAVTDAEKLTTQFGSQIDTLRKQLEDARRPNWPVWIAGLALIGGLWSYAMRPMQQVADSQERRVSHVENWQESYMLGNVPSPKLAELSQKFAEVETQFHAFKDRMVENEGYTRERADTNHHDIEVLAKEVGKQRDIAARLDERVRLPGGRTIP